MTQQPMTKQAVGAFAGYLPKSRRAEIYLYDMDDPPAWFETVLRNRQTAFLCNVAPDAVVDGEDINKLLGQRVKITFRWTEGFYDPDVLEVSFFRTEPEVPQKQGRF